MTPEVFQFQMTIGKWVIREWINPWIESATSKWAHEPLINGITYGMGNQCYLLWIRIIPWLNNGHRFDLFRSLLDVGWHHTYRHGVIPWLHPARCCCKLVYTTPLALSWTTAQRSLRKIESSLPPVLRKPASKLSSLAGTQTIDRVWLNLKFWLPSKLQAVEKKDGHHFVNKGVNCMIQQWTWCQSVFLHCSPKEMTHFLGLLKNTLRMNGFLQKKK